MKTLTLVLIAAVIGGLTGGLVAMTVLDAGEDTKYDLIKEYYDIENAVMVSPHGLRGKMDKGVNDYVLVDLRSQEEYEKEHIIGAINIPAYKDKDNSDYGAVDRIVGSFREIPKGKDIIVYCYSTPCMTGRKVGKMLADNGIFVKHLGIGWNEWRYHWTLWNHEHEWNITTVEDYIWSGPEAGVPSMKDLLSACEVGEFGC